MSRASASPRRRPRCGAGSGPSGAPRRPADARRALFRAHRSPPIAATALIYDAPVNHPPPGDRPDRPAALLLDLPAGSTGAPPRPGAPRRPARAGSRGWVYAVVTLLVLGGLVAAAVELLLPWYVRRA